MGCAFITYVVRTIGYFRIIAPEYLGFFIETDLVMGAIRATPFVVGACYIVYTLFWLVSLVIDHEDKIVRVTRPIHGIKRLSRPWMKTVALWTFYFALIVSGFVFEGENFFITLELSYLAALYVVIWTLQQYEDYGKINPFVGVAAMLSVYTALINTGKWEAIVDLNSSNARYSITATDKSYVNVILLRTSASGVLLKAGKDIILYDRSKVSKIERMADQIKLK